MCVNLCFLSSGDWGKDSADCRPQPKAPAGLLRNAGAGGLPSHADPTAPRKQQTAGAASIPKASHTSQRLKDGQAGHPSVLMGTWSSPRAGPLNLGTMDICPPCSL